jgi:predicted glycoside hydrolase/deacetylase ChbG (UPF0249 family)
VNAAAPAQPLPGARRWVSCADDFAIDAGAVDAILDLIAGGRVTATSALVDAPLWPTAARQLPLAHAGVTADIGLHLNLTQAFTRGATGIWPLSELIWRCATGRLARAPLAAAIARQFDAFEAQLNRPPDYIDGHQHVHQFGVVRDALVSEVLRRYPETHPWLRSTRPPPGVRNRKARGIAFLGDRGLRARATAAGLPTSDYLVGAYDFRAGSAADRATYREHLSGWLDAGPDGSVLMCHPSSRAEAGDPIGAARVMEYAHLGSTEFGAALHRANIVLVPGSALFTNGRA